MQQLQRLSESLAICRQRFTWDCRELMARLHSPAIWLKKKEKMKQAVMFRHEAAMKV